MKLGFQKAKSKQSLIKTLDNGFSFLKSWNKSTKIPEIVATKIEKIRE